VDKTAANMHEQTDKPESKQQSDKRIKHDFKTLIPTSRSDAFCPRRFQSVPREIGPRPLAVPTYVVSDQSAFFG
jgi:hypothetical protein